MSDNSAVTFRQLLHGIVARPWVYDAVQFLAGSRSIRAHLRPLLQVANALVLDIGAGTGNYADLLPSPDCYLWFDNDPEKLRGFKAKYAASSAVLGDASLLPFRDRSVDLALCINSSHHLSDAQLHAFLADVTRISRRGIVFLDAVKRPDSLVSSVLWKYDRGSNPRLLSELCDMIGRYFTIEFAESFHVYHQYFLCFAASKEPATRIPFAPAALEDRGILS